jgi:hypothetical protein
METNRSGPVEGFHISGVELLMIYNNNNNSIIIIIIIVVVVVVSFKCVYCELYDIETNFSLETINLQVALNNTNYSFT